MSGRKQSLSGRSKERTSLWWMARDGPGNEERERELASYASCLILQHANLQVEIQVLGMFHINICITHSLTACIQYHAMWLCSTQSQSMFLKVSYEEDSLSCPLFLLECLLFRWDESLLFFLPASPSPVTSGSSRFSSERGTAALCRGEVRKHKRDKTDTLDTQGYLSYAFSSQFFRKFVTLLIIATTVN